MPPLVYINLACPSSHSSTNTVSQTASHYLKTSKIFLQTYPNYYLSQYPKQWPLPILVFCCSPSKLPRSHRCGTGLLATRPSSSIPLRLLPTCGIEKLKIHLSSLMLSSLPRPCGIAQPRRFPSVHAACLLFPFQRLASPGPAQILDVRQPAPPARNAVFAACLPTSDLESRRASRTCDPRQVLNLCSLSSNLLWSVNTLQQRQRRKKLLHLALLPISQVVA